IATGVMPTIDEVPAGIRYPDQVQTSTDWFDEIIHQNAPFQDYNLSYYTGQNTFRTRISAGFLKEQGALKNTGFEQYSLRANVAGDINDFISTGVILSGAYSGGNLAHTNSRDGIVGRALWADPRDPVSNEDG